MRRYGRGTRVGAQGRHRLRYSRRGARASFLSGSGTRRKQINNRSTAVEVLKILFSLRRVAAGGIHFDATRRLLPDEEKNREIHLFWLLRQRQIRSSD